ncbi:MAG: DUF4032 domain-containing protein [Candidatus Nanopelagicales bacterium]
MEIVAADANPALLLLPWQVSLSEWPDDLVLDLPRGISRNLVRFVSFDADGADPPAGDPGRVVYAAKELPDRLALREYRLLGELRKLELPVVAAAAVVTGRAAEDGQPLFGIVLTRHLRFSLPYRALFAAGPDAAAAERLLDALVMLLVRLHKAGFMWGDCSLSNTLFRRDAGAYEAYLVDAETGELHPELSRGQREWDVELAMEKCAGELMDLQAGGLLTDGDPIDLGLSIGDRYRRLWRLVTDELRISDGELWRLEERTREIQAAGFEIGELVMTAHPGGAGRDVRIRPRVVESGHNSRRLVRLTGLDTGENQARRLLSDIDSFAASRLAGATEAQAAAAWMAEQYQPLVAAVPESLRGRLEPPEVYHEVLEHRWYLCQLEGRDIGWDEAVARYLADILAHKPDEAVVTPATSGPGSLELG